MEHPFLTLFKPLLEYTDQDKATAYILAHPVLFSSYYRDLLSGWAAGLDAADRVQAQRAIALTQEMYQQFRAGKLRVEASTAVLDLAMNVIEGRYTLAYTKQAASRPEFFVELRYPDVTSTCEVAEQGLNKDWRISVMVMNVLNAALDARGKVIPENQFAMERTTIESWLAVARVACTDVPDGRIFRDVVKRGEAIAEQDEGSNPPANILHRLGTLYLDTYIAGRSSTNFDYQMRTWQQRLYEEYGDKLAGIPVEELAMPTVEEGLNSALGYLRRAAARRSGEARGRTLKAIAQAQTWLDLLELPHDEAECRAAASEALTLLPEDKFPAEHAELSRVLQGLSSDAAADARAIEKARGILARPVQDWVAERGPVATSDIFEQTAASIAESDPALALQLWMAIDGVVREQRESVRAAHDAGLISFAMRAMAPDGPRADGSPVNAMLMSMFQKAGKELWPPQKVAYALLGLAASTTTTSQEAEGLEALRYCADVAQRSGSDPVLDRAIPYLASVLQTGRAVNAFDAGEIGEAAKLYTHAIDGNLLAGQPLAGLDIIRRLLDLASKDSPEHPAVLNALVAGLAANALELELGAGKAATELIQPACRLAFQALLASGTSKMTTVLFLLDAAKGRRFRSALARPGGAVEWLNHPRTLATEREMATLRAKAQNEGTTKPTALNQNMLLTAYVSPDEMSGGGTAAEQLRNLQIRFDNGLDLQLSRDDQGEWVPTLETLQATLDDKSVLAIQYIGSGPNGALAVTTLLFTDTDSAAGVALIPSVPYASVKMSSEEEAIASNVLSLTVSDLRDRIVSPPGPMAADSRALDTLERDHEMYLGGPLATKLAEYKAQGKDHICFAPHGPLHYFPFHLLGPEDEPLAAEWCVTYLPHPYLLDRKAAAATGKTELTAIGVNFAEGNVFHLDALNECEAEAATIAAAFAPASKLLVGADAKEGAVLSALATSRRVHLSTHGLHNVSAPSFQCIFVSPGDETNAGGDGILNAYELLRLDLSGLDLVTFSACETALGRFDAADNLRGIPAALLIAGVSTIVGTLWNVETETSTFFFTTFYRLLKEQGSKKSAFRQSQAETRARFPKYRDWGAFQFIGAWS